MPAKWKKRYNPVPQLARINDARNLSKDGTVSFRGIGIQEDIETLISMIEFPSVANHLDHSELIWSAISKKYEKLDSTNTLTGLNEEITRINSRKTKIYSVITSISASSNALPSKIKTNLATIHFYKKGIPRKFKDSRRKLEKTHQTNIPHTPDHYCWTRIEIEGKSPERAMQQALRELSFVRGVFATYTNFEMESSFWGSTNYSPINRIRTGGLHSIHDKSGEASVDTLWYDPDFKAGKQFKPKNAPAWKKACFSMIRRIGKSNYPEQISNALVLYANAFDESNQGTAFIKLWSALELMTTPSSPANYADIVRRCSFMHASGEYATQVLEHLREHRNGLVHRNESRGDPRIKCYQLQYYFRAAVHFYVQFGRKFSSLEEANRFLDLPTDPLIIKRSMDHLRLALRYVTPEQDPTS
ncbi:hypothetical protein [Stenotrophomonas cyclobalanopsidis]|uniref:hypothetical protein n=1 Tax=Stenotrophomonas cyclobalanopsidis TaxID=2771362 RepID=UPI0028A654A5|nr:hypothetical protein [Stenotrophomonas cyclobalanopsidis]